MCVCSSRHVVVDAGVEGVCVVDMCVQCVCAVCVQWTCVFMVDEVCNVLGGYK